MINYLSSFLYLVYPSSSEDTDRINSLFNAFLIVALIIFLGVLFSTIYITIRFSDKRITITSKSEGNRKFEIGITVTALTLVTIFSFISIKMMSEITPSEIKQKPDIVIVGHQFWWEVRYPGSNVITANELHIPVKKRLLAEVTSADVVHDWWVPALGRKMDLVPGQNNHVFIQAKEEGIYTGACSEFCGSQHAWMRIKVFVEDDNTFKQWIKNQQKEEQFLLSPIASKGKEYFFNKSCAGCHQVKGTSAKQLIGPDLTHIASRTTLLAGKEDFSLENLKKWIAHPQKEKPGAYMPDFILTDEETNAIANYLYELK